MINVLESKLILNLVKIYQCTKRTENIKSTQFSRLMFCKAEKFSACQIYIQVTQYEFEQINKNSILAKGISSVKNIIDRETAASKKAFVIASVSRKITRAFSFDALCRWFIARASRKISSKQLSGLYICYKILAKAWQSCRQPTAANLSRRVVIKSKYIRGSAKNLSA